MQPQTAMTSVRQLRRGEDRKIAGVCSGIAEYFRIDPTVVRLLFIGGLFLGAASALVYVAGWVLMPGPAPLVLPPSTGSAAVTGPPMTGPPAAQAPAPFPTAVPTVPTGTDGPRTDAR